MSQIFREGSNWVIISHLNESEIPPIQSVIDDAYEIDWSLYTSCKGEKSKQYYLINPKWMPDKSHRQPKDWNVVQEKFKTIIQSELVYHCVMPTNWKELHACSAWTAIGEKGSYHTIHDHGPSNICSVTYLKVPENQEDPAGQIYFVMHGQSYNTISPPKMQIFHVQPKVGMVVIFPSWMLHGVYPQGEGIRQTLNIDFNGNKDYKFDEPSPGGANYF
jgi:uncharacterized protein (TIGR02466 family)